MKEKIIFLDRDGVINKDPQEKKYVTRLEDFEFIKGSLGAINRLSRSGYKVFIISNQQGIGKGFYSQEMLDDITKYMLREIEKKGGKVASVYYCTHTEAENCPCRKPKTGLIEKAISGLDINLRETFFVGDTENDIKTGRAAKCRTILLLSGKTTKESEIKNWQVRPDYVFSDLGNAVDFILEK